MSDSLLSGEGGGESTAVAEPTSAPEASSAPVTEAPTSEPESFNFAGFEAFYGEEGLKPGVLESLGEEHKSLKNFLIKYPTGNGANKGFDNIVQLALGKSLEPLHDGSDEKEVEFFNNTIKRALNVPDSPDGYGVKQPENLPEGVNWNQEEAEAFAAFAHERNLSPQAVNDLLQWDMERQAKMSEGLTQQIEAQKAQEMQTLQNEFGDKTKNYLDGAQEILLAGAEAAGVSEEKALELASSADAIKILNVFKNMVSEDSLVKTGGSMRENVVSSAQATLDKMFNDPASADHQDLFSGDPVRVRRAQEKKLAAQKILNPPKR